ncbi:MAG: cupin domain-containing protein [Candidatus Nitrosocosmicus sp.]
MHPEAEYIIKKLDLVELVKEGGYYRETYRSNDQILINSSFDERSRDSVYCFSKFKSCSTDVRSVCTLIYYLLEGDQFSAFHKVKYDEIWHFYKGSSISLYILTEDENILNIKIGNDLRNNEYFQYIIRGNNWFAAELNDNSLFSLIGCSVAPGFDFRDFELGERNELKNIYPQHEFIIDRLTRH